MRGVSQRFEFLPSCSAGTAPGRAIALLMPQRVGRWDSFFFAPFPEALSKGQNSRSLVQDRMMLSEAKRIAIEKNVCPVVASQKSYGLSRVA